MLLAVLVGLFVWLRGGGLGDPPEDRIDAASRQRLERVLREAERVPVEPGRGERR